LIQDCQRDAQNFEPLVALPTIFYFPVDLIDVRRWEDVEMTFLGDHDVLFFFLPAFFYTLWLFFQ
jgi:hypothetical protein